MEDNNQINNQEEYNKYLQQLELKRQEEEYFKQKQLEYQQQIDLEKNKPKVLSKKEQRKIEKEQKRLEKEELKKIKASRPSNKPNVFLIISNVISLLTVLGLTGGLFLYKGAYSWMFAAFTFLLLSIIMLFLLVFLGKKTHAIMELNAMLTGKPISLFFTDHKKMEWRVIEPEGNILSDKKYGSFLINEKGAYVDAKTKNIFLAFNPAVATNAAIECYKVTDSLNKVLNDEKQLSYLRYALSTGKVKNNTIEYINPETQEKEVLNEFEVIRENVNFSHLKSLLVTLIPHSITSKIEMTVQQRMSGFGKVNILQIILLIIGLVGGITLCIILLKMYGGGGGTSTIVKEVATTAATNVGVIKG